MCSSSFLNPDLNPLSVRPFCSDVCLLLSWRLQEVDGSLPEGRSSPWAVRLLLHRRVWRQPELWAPAAVGTWGRGRCHRQGGIPGINLISKSDCILFNFKFSRCHVKCSPISLIKWDIQDYNSNNCCHTKTVFSRFLSQHDRDTIKLSCAEFYLHLLLSFYLCSCW